MAQPEPDDWDDYAESIDDDSGDEDEELEEGELNLFASMPWLNQSVGSMMEAQLTRYREPNQCRQCGKVDEALREKTVEKKFCSDVHEREWRALAEARIAQGLHDLRMRWYD